jgi:glycosyltransferase involved in cell wall biosynthesis
MVITSRFPFPLEKGDKLRVYNQIKTLGKEHDVYLVAISSKKPTHEQMAALTPYCKEIKPIVIPVLLSLFKLITCIFNKMPFQVAWFYSSKQKRKVHKYIRQVAPHAIYCHLIRCSEYVKDVKEIHKTLDYMDCFSKGVFLRIMQTRNPLKRKLLSIEAKRLAGYERKIFDSFENHTIISNQDRNAIKHDNKQNINILANGVDSSIFYPVASEKNYDVLFTGNMAYPPNIDAAYFAATQIFPLVLKQEPNAKMLIAGINPPQKIKQLESSHLHVQHNFDHIRDAYITSKVNLTPTVTSVGLQNKILQALAMKIPTVTTPAGARGIDSEKEDVVMIGNTAQSLADLVVKLIRDKKLYDEMAEKGYQYVIKKFNWANINDQLIKLLLPNEKL